MSVHEYSETCKYHQTEVSNWSCANCNTNYCSKCVPNGHSSHWGQYGPRCYLCNKELIYHAEMEDITPFWANLNEFFKYPLHKNCLPIILTFSIAGLVLPFLLAFGFIGALLFVIAFLVMLSMVFKYSFLIIEKRSVNEEDPPTYDDLLDADNAGLAIKLLVASAIMYGAAAFLSNGNDALRLLLSSIVTLALPAMTIILAIEQSLRVTLNPLMIISFVGRIGWAYLLLWLCYQIVSSGPLYIFMKFGGVLPDFVMVPSFIAVCLYFWFAANCMLGYIVYQYHDELGHTTFLTHNDDVDLTKADFEKQRVLAEANIQVREKNASGARANLRPLLDQYPHDKDLHQFYHRLLVHLEDKQSLVNHSDHFIGVLLEQKDRSAAAGVYLDTLAKVPNYQPKSVDHAWEIAQVLEQRGQKKAIVKLLNNIHKINPKHPSIAPAYFLLARVYREHLSKDVQAKKIIEFLLDKYPKTEIRKSLIDYHKSFSL